jgi:hypothetical protein
MWNRIRSLAAAFGFALSFAANSQAAVIINIQGLGPTLSCPQPVERLI